MLVNKDFKNSKTNRAELDDLQNANPSDSSSKMIYCFKCDLQKHNHKTLNTI